MKNIDLREYKGALRRESKAYRQSLPAEAKAKKDSAILRRLLALRQYQQASLVLTYVSTAIEVDTRELIRQALADGKRVGVPRCIDGTRLMEFYEIGSLDDLFHGARAARFAAVRFLLKLGAGWAIGFGL